MDESEKRYWLDKYHKGETIKLASYDSESFSGLRILYANDEYIICQKVKRFGSDDYDKPKKRSLYIDRDDRYYFLYDGSRHYIDSFIRANYWIML